MQAQAAVKTKKRHVNIKAKVDLMFSMKSLKSKRGQGGYLPSNSQLVDFEEKTFFIASEVVNFCNHDEQSPFNKNGKYMKVQVLENWLLCGKVKGVKPNFHWYVSKEEVLQLFNSYQ